MKKIGVFLGFQPGVNLTTEGIGRLLAFILKENGENSMSIILLCPSWLKESVNILLEDNKIPTDRFEVLSTDNVPIGVRVKSWIKLRQRKEKKRSKNRLIQSIKKSVINLIRNSISDFFSTSSWYLLMCKFFIYVIALLVLSPLLLCSIVIYLIYIITQLLVKSVKYIVKKTVSVESFTVSLRSLLSKGQGKIYQIVLDNELNRLVKKINTRKDITICFIPSMIWPQISYLNAKKVLAAPDIVFYDFPTQFKGVDEIHRRIRQSIDVADHLICYSETVKYHHLVNKCGVNEQKVTVIKHANVDMSEHLKVSNSIEKYFTANQNAQQIVNRYIKAYFSPGHILYNCDITKLDYIIYSSQNRPHKNIFNLIKAIKIINKDMYKNVKLILTGNISDSVDIQRYMELNYLQNDIIIMNGLPSEVLAAFNKLATCAVNPTLFEGGFPFTFSEAYSVGTPSVMSCIPVVENEIANPYLKKIMLFDPYNPKSIANRIVWATENVQVLFDAQAELYENFSRRDWGKVVGEYNRVFRGYM